MTASGILYVIATPLGNPSDLSPRAVTTLRELDVLFAEDTRSAHALLAAHGLSVPMMRSCFDANEGARAVELVNLLADGKRVGLVSEAGTPGICDPGYRVIRAAVEAGARVVPIPGPAAVITALVASGLPTDRFLFLGFPPRKTGARHTLFASVRGLPATLVLYESPLRTGATLADLRDALGDRPACVARELTKTHEELVRGTLSELAARYAKDRPLGEVTIVVAGASEDAAAAEDEATLEARAEALLESGQSAREVTRRLAAETGRPRREIYDLVLRLRGEEPDRTGAAAADPQKAESPEDPAD